MVLERWQRTYGNDNIEDWQLVGLAGGYGLCEKDILQKANRMKASRQRFEYLILSGVKNSSPTYTESSAKVEFKVYVNLTAYWQYRQLCESLGLSR